MPAITARQESAQVYELFKGDLSPVCKLIKWCYVLLTQEVYITVPPRPGFELLFGKQKVVNGQKRWYSKLTWRGRTVNTPKRWYRADKSGTTGPEDGSTIPDKPGTGGTEQEWPDYTGVLRDYYEITRQLPWEGTLQSLRALSPAGLVGRQLSITGGRAEWVDMSTVVQGVSVDLAGSSTSINTGVPAHLSLQDMLDRAKSLQSGQDVLDQDDQQDNPILTIQYDDNAYKSPEAPTIGPEGEVIWNEAPDRPAGFGFQVVLDWDDDNTTVTGYRLRPGATASQRDDVLQRRPGTYRGRLVQGGRYQRGNLAQCEVQRQRQVPGQHGSVFARSGESFAPPTGRTGRGRVLLLLPPGHDYT